MGKTQRYFSADKSEGSGEVKPDPEGEKKQNKPNVKVKTFVASSIPRRFNKDRNRKFFKGKKVSKKQGKAKSDDPFPDKAPVPKQQLNRYNRGKGLTGSARKTITTNVRAKKIIEKDKKISSGLEQAARAELLLLESPG